MQRMTGSFNISNDGNTGGVLSITFPTGVFESLQDAAGITFQYTGYTSNGGGRGISFDSTRSARTGNETKSVSLSKALYITY